MKINQRNRYIGAIFLLAAGLAVGGAPVLLEKKATAATYVPPNPPPLKFTETQQAAIKTCFDSIQPAEPTPATKPVGLEVPVVLYHRVTNDDDPSPTVIHPRRFRQEMDALKEDGYTTVSVIELIDYMKGHGKIPPKPVLITFDDGWKDNIEAAAYLKKLNFKATFFVISGFFDTPQYFSEDDVKELAKNPNFEIGSHTHTHFIKYEADMTKLQLCTMAEEMVGSRAVLEHLLKKPVTALAWPYGFNTKEAVTLAKRYGYEATLHVNRDAHNAPGNSPYFIRRMNIDGNCSVDDFRSMVQTRTLKECS